MTKRNWPGEWKRNRINSWREHASFSYTRHVCGISYLLGHIVNLCCPESDLSSSIDMVVYHLTVNVFWNYSSILGQIYGHTRIKKVFSKLADCLRGAGYERTSAQRKTENLEREKRSVRILVFLKAGMSIKCTVVPLCKKCFRRNIHLKVF